MFSGFGALWHRSFAAFRRVNIVFWGVCQQYQYMGIYSYPLIQSRAPLAIPSLSKATLNAQSLESLPCGAHKVSEGPS